MRYNVAYVKQRSLQCEPRSMSQLMLPRAGKQRTQPAAQPAPSGGTEGAVSPAVVAAAAAPEVLDKLGELTQIFAQLADSAGFKV
jgi:hypothetical protein